MLGSLGILIQNSDGSGNSKPRLMIFLSTMYCKTLKNHQKCTKIWPEMKKKRLLQLAF